MENERKYETILPILNFKNKKKKYSIEFIHEMFKENLTIKSKIEKDKITFKAGSIMRCYYNEFELNYDYQFHALDFKTDKWRSIDLREKVSNKVLDLFHNREQKEIFYEMLNVMIQNITLGGYISRFIRIEPLNEVFYYLSYIITE
jgi:hypothetical protein